MSGAVPTFTTERLILRELSEEYAASYEKHFVDYEIVSQLAKSVPWPYPAGGILDFIRTDVAPNQGKGRWVWAIFLKTSPEEAIGCVDLVRKTSPANRGFWLGKKFWGQGYMTEAVKPVMDYAFGNLGFEKLIFANAVGNDKSSRVKAKTGAKLLRREPAEYKNPAYSEREIWELTKEDWKKLKS